MHSLFAALHSSNTNNGNAVKKIYHSMPELEHENMLLRLILASSSEPILITSADTKIIYANPAWENLTGYTLNEIAGKNPRFLQSGKTPRDIYKKLWTSLKKEIPFTTDEIIDRKKDGNTYNIHATFFPVLTGGVTAYYVQILYDLTKEKLLEDLRTEFLPTVGHELRTPITVMKLLIQSHLAKAKSHYVHRIKTSELKAINRELDRLTNLVGDVLDSSKLETGQLTLHFKTIDLARLTKDVIKKMMLFAGDHPIHLKNNQKIPVIADPVRIEQVIVNILSNAVKYSSSKKPISLGFILNNKHVITWIKDEGVGIGKKKEKIIFDRYFQIKTKGTDGFGLGLYISKQIIKRHKGKMWVESEEGKGSTFYFSLPINA